MTAIAIVWMALVSVIEQENIKKNVFFMGAVKMWKWNGKHFIHNSNENYKNALQ